ENQRRQHERHVAVSEAAELARAVEELEQERGPRARQSRDENFAPESRPASLASEKVVLELRQRLLHERHREGEVVERALDSVVSIRKSHFSPNHSRRQPRSPIRA